MSKVTKGELMDYAKENGIDPDQSYMELTEEIDVRVCKECQDEFLYGWSEKFCTDACETEYIQKWG